jgi:hypothetical protein
MLNRNFKTVMLGWLMSSRATGTSTPSFNPQIIYSVDGEESSYPSTDTNPSEQATKAIINTLSHPTTNNIIAKQSQNRLFIAVGTGTKEATDEDYTLESENTDITCEAITQTYTPSYKRQITATFNNSTNQDINIKEAGLFMETYAASSNYISTIMLARENIDVTIPAGESKSITMEIG